MQTVTRRPEARVRLGDGAELGLRPIHPDDKPLFVEGFHRLSPRTRYLRFMTPVGRLTNRQLTYLSELDFRHHVAWGVLDGETAVAVGRFVRMPDDPTTADVAVTVVDDHQRRGIGRMLLQVLAASARSRGIGRFHFDVLAENTAMLRLLESLGGRRIGNDEVVQIVVEVGRLPAPQVVDGDLTHLLEEACRAAARSGDDYSDGSRSSDAEFTQ